MKMPVCVKCEFNKGTFHYDLVIENIDRVTELNYWDRVDMFKFILRNFPDETLKCLKFAIDNLMDFRRVREIHRTKPSLLTQFAEDYFKDMEVK